MFVESMFVWIIIIAVSFFAAGWVWRGNYEKHKSEEEKKLNK